MDASVFGISAKLSTVAEFKQAVFSKLATEHNPVKFILSSYKKSRLGIIQAKSTQKSTSPANQIRQFTSTSAQQYEFYAATCEQLFLVYLEQCVETALNLHNRPANDSRFKFLCEMKYRALSCFRPGCFNLYAVGLSQCAVLMVLTKRVASTHCFRVSGYEQVCGC